MVTKAQYAQITARVLVMLDANNIALTPEERANIEVADFGLNEIEQTGLQIITYINTERVCAKELVMLPHQTCPEHRHPTINGVPGKEETFRCRAGEVTIHVPGETITLRPGQQYTLLPDTLHWFQAGADGAIVSEFSTRSTDEADIFTDTRIVRAPVVV